MQEHKCGATLLSAATSVVLWILLSALPAGAATLYVDAANESGVEDGTSENPYRTIQQAVAAAVSGDTVRVAAGSYFGPVTITGKRLHLFGADPVATTIAAGASGIIANGTYIEGQNVVEVAGFTISGASLAGVNFASATVAGKVHNCIISSNFYGVYVSLGGSVTVSNNVIEGSSSYGLIASASSASLISNIIIDNNYGAYSYNRSTVSSSYNCYYHNNTNTHWDSVSSLGSINDTFNEDPKFVDRNTGDYHLQVDSPCVNMGNPSAAYLDPDGTRNDKGVYGGPGAAAFWPLPAGAPVVTELSVTPHDVALGGTLTIKAKGRAR